MRRRKLRLAALALLFPTAVLAQNGDVALSITTLDSRPIIEVTNNSDLPVTGLVITVDLTGNGRALTRIYYDVYVNWKRDVPIPPGSLLQMPLPHRVGASMTEWPTPVLQAVVFSDGASTGDARWIHDLLRRRQIANARLREVAALLKDISERKVTKAEAVAILQRSRQTRWTAVASDPLEEKLLHDVFFSMAIKNIVSDFRLNGKVAEVSITAGRVGLLLNKWRLLLESAKPTSSGLPESREYQDHDQPDRSSQFHKARLLPATLLATTGKKRPFSFRIAVSASPVECIAAPDLSEVLYGFGICGSQYWELKARVSTLPNGPNATYSFATGSAYGVCTGGFTNCQGNYVQQGFETGEVHKFGAVAPPDQTALYWELDTWFNEYSDCECSDPYQQGHNEDQFNLPYRTPIFYVDCP